MEIDDDEWGDIEADPDTRLELTGEIDRDSDDVELDIEHVRVAP